MYVGYEKYHPGGTYLTYKGKTVPCLVKFSEGGVIPGHILTKLLRHFDDLKVYENDGENGIINALLVDGHVSCFVLSFFKCICDGNLK